MTSCFTVLETDLIEDTSHLIDTSRLMAVETYLIDTSRLIAAETYLMEDTSRLIASETLLEWLEYSWYVGGSLGLTASCFAAATILQAPSIMALPAETMGSWAFLA